MTSAEAAALLVGAQLSSDDTSEGVAGELGRVWAQLEARLARWIGHEACRILAERAWKATSARHPALPRLGSGPGAELRVAEVGREAAVGAFEAFVEDFIRRLGKFVGIDVAIRMVLPGTTASGDPGEL